MSVVKYMVVAFDGSMLPGLDHELFVSETWILGSKQFSLPGRIGPA